MPTHGQHVTAGKVRLGLSVFAKPLPHHAHSGRRLVQEDVHGSSGAERGVVGGADGDVVVTVVVSLVTVAGDQVGEGEGVVVTLAVPD